MEIFTRRSTKVGLFAVALAGLAAASTGMALAADSRPSVQLTICLREDGKRVEGPWEISVTGINQNGDSLTQSFAGDGCTTLRKDETEYWWALGTKLKTVINGTPAEDVDLEDKPDLDGHTMTYTLQRP